MAKFEARIYVLQSEWETRWVTIDANSEEEAKEKIADHDYEVVDEEMGDIENSKNAKIKLNITPPDVNQSFWIVPLFIYSSSSPL